MCLDRNYPRSGSAYRKRPGPMVDEGSSTGPFSKGRSDGRYLDGEGDGQGVPGPIGGGLSHAPRDRKALAGEIR